MRGKQSKGLTKKGLSRISADLSKFEIGQKSDANIPDNLENSEDSKAKSLSATDTFFQKNEIQERRDEIAKLAEKKLVSDKKSKIERENVEKLLLNQQTLWLSYFSEEGEKSKGKTKGFKATDQQFRELYLIKECPRNFTKNSTLIEVNELDELSSKILTEADYIKNSQRIFFVSAFVASGLYKLILHDRAPNQALILSDDEEDDRIFLRSQWVERSMDLGTLLELQKSHPEQTKDLPRPLVGFEKYMAACCLFGESDIHVGNILVSEEGVVMKIDHERFLFSAKDSFLAWLNDVHGAFCRLIYSEDKSERRSMYSLLHQRTLSFNLFRYLDAMKQMLSQLSENEINVIIDRSMMTLEEAGFDPQLLVKDTLYLGFSEIGQEYKRRLVQNIDFAKSLIQDLEIISRFVSVENSFFSNEWIMTFALSDFIDPIAYAIQINTDIDDLDPVAFSVVYHVDPKSPRLQSDSLYDQKRLEVANDIVEARPTSPVALFNRGLLLDRQSRLTILSDGKTRSKLRHKALTRYIEGIVQYEKQKIQKPTLLCGLLLRSATLYFEEGAPESANALVKKMNEAGLAALLEDPRCAPLMNQFDDLLLSLKTGPANRNPRRKF